MGIELGIETPAIRELSDLMERRKPRGRMVPSEAAQTGMDTIDSRFQIPDFRFQISDS
jgi:hypothetical protein